MLCGEGGAACFPLLPAASAVRRSDEVDQQPSFSRRRFSPGPGRLALPRLPDYNSRPVAAPLFSLISVARGEIALFREGGPLFEGTFCVAAGDGALLEKKSAVVEAALPQKGGSQKHGGGRARRQRGELAPDQSFGFTNKISVAQQILQRQARQGRFGKDDQPGTPGLRLLERAADPGGVAL